MEEAEYSISIIDVDAIETRLEWKQKIRNTYLDDAITT